MDIIGAGWRVSDATYRFLQGTGRKLEVANRERVDDLVSQRIYVGWARLAIDRSWVRFEQRLVESQLNSLAPATRRELTSNINSILNGRNPFPGDWDFRNALRLTRQQLDRDIDFDLESDRVRLGDNLNDIYRTRSCSGSRIGQC